jgi:hypothetical protein
MFDRLRAIWRLTAVIRWPCAYCKHPNVTSGLVWQDVKYRLICEECSYMQSYPDHVKDYDPVPPARFRNAAV